MAVASELMASGLSALSSNLLGDDSGPIVLTYNSEGVIPASESPAGFAITNNYHGYGEVNFWNLVNNDDVSNQGWYFEQKTGTDTFKTIGTIIRTSTLSAFTLNSPGGTLSGGIYSSDPGVAFGTPNDGILELITNDLPRLTIAANGAVSIVGSLLQNKAVATPVTGATVTMTADQRYQAIAPAGTIAALTLVLPPSPVNSQVMSAGSSQIVTALTVSAGTGAATIVGAPTAFAAGSGFAMVYQSSNNTWYRTG